MTSYYDGNCSASPESLHAWGCWLWGVLAFWACALGFVAHALLEWAR